MRLDKFVTMNSQGFDQTSCVGVSARIVYSGDKVADKGTIILYLPFRTKPIA